MRKLFSPSRGSPDSPGPGHRRGVEGGAETGAARRVQAYTLLELLVVMLVLGILGSVGLYSFQQLRNPARDASQQLIGVLSQVRTSALSNTLAYRLQLTKQSFSVQSAISCTSTAWTAVSTVPVSSVATDATYTTTPAATVAAPATVACFSARGLAVNVTPVVISDLRNHSYTLQTYVGGSIRVVKNGP